MATAKRSVIQKPKQRRPNAAEVRAENDKLKKDIEKLNEDKEKLQEKIDKLNDSCWCYMCGAHKSKLHFYVSTDARIKSGYAPICIECARKLALRVDKNGEEHEPTRESVQLALKYLDKPFLESVWNSSIQESENMSLGRTKNNVWTSYIKNIQMKNYIGLTWKDSDMFKEHIVYDDEMTEQELVESHSGQDTYDAFLKNKADVVRLLDYDPFEQEPVRDQPFLYSQLLGLLDASEDANEDMLRVSSAIQIVRAFLQLSKIDDAMAKLMGDIKMVAENSGTIKSLQDSKQKLTSMITTLAAENCLSLKNSKSQTKGENTFTGKLKRIRSYNLRESDLNGFSVGTCKGMQQVANISMSAIIDKLSMDDSEWADIVKNQRIMLDSANKKADSIEEAFRILLRENLDMRKTLEDKELINEDELINLDDLLGTYITNTEEAKPDEAV